jgi:hypothetical protein
MGHTSACPGRFFKVEQLRLPGECKRWVALTMNMVFRTLVHKYILDLGGTPGDQGLVGEAEWYQQATVKQAELLACMSCQVL